MPFLPDGTPLDIVLNPLGVPSRMNIGQVLEVNLGYAAKACGIKVMTPVFDCARENDIGDTFDDRPRDVARRECSREYPTKLPKIMGEKGHIIDFSKIELDRDGKTTVYDGRTGEKFDNRVTVGYMYYLKLHHLVDDKIHARSTGPYSWSPSSLWAARLSSAASASARWKSGRWKLTAPLTPCRRS